MSKVHNEEKTNKNTQPKNRDSKLELKTRPVCVRVLPDGTVMTTSEFLALLE